MRKKKSKITQHAKSYVSFSQSAELRLSGQKALSLNIVKVYCRIPLKAILQDPHI